MNLRTNSAFMKNRQEAFCYIHPDAHVSLVSAINRHLPKEADAYSIVIVCIGTDRSTGDALGPLVGMHLRQYTLNNTHIYGTLDQPVHAVNLQNTMEEVQAMHDHPFIIAVDACLGHRHHVGKVCVSEGPVRPGSGVNKKLPPVGDMNITGIVNLSGYMEYAVLQNTRLSLVMKLSRAISRSLYIALFSREKRSILTGRAFSDDSAHSL
ncbi:spore protease YyaC [Sporolactobacillus sp. THM19-2]|uniref:spore protease YyaC n=1 Tax=Sporolactobacillus sp. THM19-2 TaxID=2511171 RepID=UPI00101FBDEF|nr:spore protease YyaC [Sporolactobacillus sp. THM19-2]RYL94171.1 spore protease YyaC [Sporolactobacillus sp. THM19-2]